MKFRTRRILPLALAGALSFGLAACEVEDDDPGTTVVDGDDDADDGGDTVIEGDEGDEGDDTDVTVEDDAEATTDDTSTSTDG